MSIVSICLTGLWAEIWKSGTAMCYILRIFINHGVANLPVPDILFIFLPMISNITRWPALRHDGTGRIYRRQNNDSITIKLI